MEKKDVLPKVLAVTGTILVWIPLAATIITSMIGTISTGELRFDYLMPAELSPAALLGGLFLTVAAFLAHSHQKPILWSLIVATVALVGGQAYAVVSGLASGAVEAAGLPWAIVIASLAVFTMALFALCITAVRFTRKLYGK